ncbi:hypothetical protein GUJ93_ZPchr0010g10382 [Zizania palustris]|uniref:RIN4 pathogenic type III effector avirulence factor Avr cleavage site domain-containing protein n=1 Tax=Zizania palustris TaxID=103762 RepID=A0A8J5WGI9_ZIZPA|nr:hypothetical protein GUJ93_ZPchr0010g10382 [Zizania palustris]
MAQQKKANVPKFGNWDNDGYVPYTVYFENARKGKGAGGKMINPNDPAENPEAFSVVDPPPTRTPPPHHEREPSDAPPAVPQNPYAGSPYHRQAGGEPPRRAPGGGGGGRAGGYSVEQSPSPSPLHPYSQSRADNSDSGSYGLVAKGLPRGNETPTRGSAVPKFGDWDNNPSSADGYTHIFNKVREEKHGQAGKPPGHGKDAAHGKGYKQHDDGYASTKCSCFGWFK